MKILTLLLMSILIANAGLVYADSPCPDPATSEIKTSTYQQGCTNSSPELTIDNKVVLQQSKLTNTNTIIQNDTDVSNATIHATTLVINERVNATNATISATNLCFNSKSVTLTGANITCTGTNQSRSFFEDAGVASVTCSIYLVRTGC